MRMYKVEALLRAWVQRWRLRRARQKESETAGKDVQQQSITTESRGSLLTPVVIGQQRRARRSEYISESLAINAVSKMATNAETKSKADALKIARARRLARGASQFVVPVIKDIDTADWSSSDSSFGSDSESEDNLSEQVVTAELTSSTPPGTAALDKNLSKVSSSPEP